MATYDECWWVQWRAEGLYYALRAAGNNDPLQEGECPGWESLPAPAGARLALFVPGAGVRVHPVSIPTRNRRRFLAALPFALEERLFHPPEAYHFVPLSRSVGRAPTPVAVVEHEQLAAWVDTVEKHGWRLETLIPDYLLLPEPEPDTWLLDGTAMPLLLRFPEMNGGAALNGAVDSQPPGALLLALEQAERRPRRLEVRVHDHDQYQLVGNWQSRLNDFDIELQRVQARLPRPAWLARQPLPAGAGNLLTDSYTPGKDRLMPARRLMPAAGLAAALVIVLAAQWLLENARLRAEHDQLSRTIEATYRGAFPAARHLVDPRHQMEQQLVAMRRPADIRKQADILTWLEQLAPYINDATGTRLRAFNFDGEQLVLELSLPDFETLEALQKQLAASLLLRVENTEFRDGRVYSRIHLEGQA